MNSADANTVKNTMSLPKVKVEVRAQYGLQVGDGYVSQNVSANLVWRF
jgi:uncharacterized protein with beta-barrel porin domain